MLRYKPPVPSDNKPVRSDKYDQRNGYTFARDANRAALLMDEKEKKKMTLDQLKLFSTQVLNSITDKTIPSE